MSESTSTALAPRSNTLAVYDRVTDPIAFAETLARDAASMMGAPVDQGRAIAMHALCEGLTLVEMRRRYHWIEGGPTMRADAMLAEFEMNEGGHYLVMERSTDAAEAEFTDRKGRVYRERFTWEEAQQERYPWRKGKSPGMAPTAENLKDNWCTPRGRRQMLWARMVSDALRYVCPRLVAGVYTPEEMMDGEFTVSAAEQKPRATIEELAARASASAATKEEAEDAEFTPAEGVSGDAPGSIAARQAELINQLFDDIGFSPDKRSEILSKRQANSVRNLSHEQADELIDRLRALQQQQSQSRGN